MCVPVVLLQLILFTVMLGEQFYKDTESRDEMSDSTGEFAHRYELVQGQGESTKHQQTASSGGERVCYPVEIKPRYSPKNEPYRNSPLNHGENRRIQRYRSKYETYTNKQGQETTKRVPPNLLHRVTDGHDYHVTRE